MWSSILTWNNLGLLLTALGTGLSFWQSYKAKTYKDEIKADRASLALYELIPKGLSAKDECKKIKTPLNLGKVVRGLDYDAVIDSIETFHEALEVNQHRIGNPESLLLDMSKLKEYLTKYRQASEASVRFSIADTLYGHLNSINIELAKLRDK